MPATDAEKPANPPSAWIVRFAALIDGPVLDLACGSGRHTRLFLARGHHVTAIDRDIGGLADLAEHKRLTRHEIDLEKTTTRCQIDNVLSDSAFAGVIVTNYLHRPLLPAIVAAVAPGGVLLYETFAVGNAAFGKPRNPDFLLEPGELLEAVRGALAVVAYEHGVTQTPQPAVVQRICAVRRDAGAVALA